MRYLILILVTLTPVFAAIEFNGSNQNISFGSVYPNATGITAMCWVKFDNASVSDERVVAYLDTNTFFILGANGSSLRVYTTTFLSSSAGETITEWNHLAMRATESGTMYILVNGQPAGSVSIGNYSSGSNLGKIGSARDSTQFTDGRVFDVRIYNRQLSADEIQSIYHARGSDKIVTGLAARWKLDESPDGTTASGASSIIDISGNGNHGTPANSPVYRAAPFRVASVTPPRDSPTPDPQPATTWQTLCHAITNREDTLCAA